MGLEPTQGASLREREDLLSPPQENSSQRSHSQSLCVPVGSIGSLMKKRLLFIQHGWGNHFPFLTRPGDMLGHREGENQPPLMGLSKQAEVRFSFCNLAKPRFGSPARVHRSQAK